MEKLDFILLIDDSDADNHYHKMVIRRAGIKCRVQSIISSREALQYLQNAISSEDTSAHPLPQLIFLDINMPAMNGFELLNKLRIHPDIHGRKKNTKIYMLTGSMNPDDRALVLEQYADLISGFHIKPLTEAVIREITKEIAVS